MKIGAVVSFALLTLLGAGTAHAGPGRGQDDRVTARRMLVQSSTRSGGGTVVYLNRAGGTVRGGYEDSSSSRSSIVYSAGAAAITVPSYARGGESWNRLLKCVRGQFRDFDVTIVDQRPRSGPYLMTMVGGTPGMLGFSRGVGGVAPYNGGVIGNAIGFVFEQSIQGERSRCEATAHEIGHSLGLDHSYLCNDIMSYRQCGPKAFRNRTEHCGEFNKRFCGNGSDRQNSYALLASKVGLRRNKPNVEPKPQPKPQPKPRTKPQPDRNERSSGPGPKVAVTKAPRDWYANSVYTVQLKARDRDGIARVELEWVGGGKRYRLQCGRIPSNVPAVCGRRGDNYAFALAVGTGNRKFRVKVTDGRGNTTVSPIHLARFR